MRGAKATGPQTPVYVSPPCASTAGWVHGDVDIAPQNQHHQVRGDAQLILCPPGAPSPAPTTRDVQGCTQDIGGDKERVILLSWESQHLVSTWWRGPRLPEGYNCFPKICWCWQGGHRPAAPAFHPPCSHPPAQGRGWHCWGTQGSVRLLPLLWAPLPIKGRARAPKESQSTPPIQERWGQLPWETTQAPSLWVGTQCPSPAETPHPSHQWWRRGCTGGGSSPH